LSGSDRPNFRPAHPEDFIVEEIPAFAPEGQGDHCFVHIEKRLLSTPEAVARIAATLGADPKTAGFAGMKDRVAVARQWVSLPGVLPEQAMALEAIDGVRVLAAALHPRRLRTGQLSGNRFTVRLRGIYDIAAALEKLAAQGIDNRFGPQRFAGDNAARGQALVLGQAPPPRGRIERRMLVSAIQAAVFNDYLDRRGDRVDLEGEPLRRGRPSGPVPGYRMLRAAEGTPARALEDEVLARAGITLLDFRRVKRLGRGTRRPLRLEIEEAAWWPAEDGDGTVVRFRLSPGSYASEVISELLSRAAQIRPACASSTCSTQ